MVKQLLCSASRNRQQQRAGVFRAGMHPVAGDAQFAAPLGMVRAAGDAGFALAVPVESADLEESSPAFNYLKEQGVFIRFA